MRLLARGFGVARASGLARGLWRLMGLDTPYTVQGVFKQRISGLRVEVFRESRCGFCVDVLLVPLFSLITWPSTLEFVFSQNHAWTLRISKHQDLLMAGGCWNRICLGGVLRQFGVDQLLRPRSQVEKQGLTSGFVVSGFVGVCRAQELFSGSGLAAL